MGYFEALSQNIKNRRAVLGVVGIGYVGTALAIAAAKEGFKVVGFTRSEARALKVNSQNISNYTATTEINNLLKCDVIAICVPTPIHEDKTPDLFPLQDALIKTAEHLQPGILVIIESTVAPGTTRNVALPILKTSGLSEDEFFLAFSPERVDPGNKKFTMNNTPKVVGGINKQSLKLVSSFYKAFVKKVVEVSTLEASEMSKILENTFRLVNISLMNELLPYTNKAGINLWEVIGASATKPFGFIPHYPGPGVGGHCIAVDPYYLLDDAKKLGVSLKMIERAGEINDEQPKKVVEKTIDIIQKTNGHKKTHSAMLIGISYKENVDDKRESPSLKLWELLEKENIKVEYHDPYIPSQNGVSSREITESVLSDKDIIIIATAHSSINYEALLSCGKPIIDTRNILKGNSSPQIHRI